MDTLPEKKGNSPFTHKRELYYSNFCVCVHKGQHWAAALKPLIKNKKYITELSSHHVKIVI